MRFELFLDARRFAGALAKVIELCTPDVAAALHLDTCDQRRIRLEGTLHAFARRDLAHDERGVQAAVALRDHDAFVRLYPFAISFDDVYVNHNCIARGKVGDGLSEPLYFF